MRKMLFFVLFLLAAPVFGQVTKSEMQARTEWLDSIAQSMHAIHVFTSVGNSEPQLVADAIRWEFRNGFIVLNDEKFFSIDHLVWFQIYERRAGDKVLQLYFN